MKLRNKEYPLFLSFDSIPDWEITVYQEKSGLCVLEDSDSLLYTKENFTNIEEIISYVNNFVYEFNMTESNCYESLEAVAKDLGSAQVSCVSRLKV